MEKEKLQDTIERCLRKTLKKIGFRIKEGIASMVRCIGVCGSSNEKVMLDLKCPINYRINYRKMRAGHRVCSR